MNDNQAIDVVSAVCAECGGRAVEPVVFYERRGRVEALCLPKCAVRHGWPWLTKAGQQHEMPL